MKWIDAEHTTFECVVKYAEFNEEHPTGVNANDSYAHIYEIWTKGIAGEYGEIAEYVVPIREVAEDQPDTSGLREM